MQIILLESINRLGNMGETVDVKPGFARNFLLPQGKALPATTANLEKFEAQKKELEKQDADRKNTAEAMAQKLDGVIVALSRQASDAGQLYGSVKVSDIANALNEKGLDVPAAAINVGDPIKAVGEYNVSVVLHPQVQLTLPVHVERLSA